MNKRNLNHQDSKSIPPRQFPKQQYSQLTHKLGLIIIILIILILGSAGTIYWQSQYHSIPSQTSHKSINHKSHKSTKNESTNTYNITNVNKINVKQGEHLLGNWIRKLHYPTSKSQAILLDYQRQNQTKEFKISQQINQITHSSINNTRKSQQIRKLIKNNF